MVSEIPVFVLERGISYSRDTCLTPSSFRNHSQGRQQRTKQGDPAPLAGSTAHPNSEARIGKKKAGLEAKSLREGTTQSPRGGRAGAARGAKRDTKGRVTGGFSSGRGSGQGAERPAKRSKKGPAKKAKKGSDEDSDDEDDIEGMKDENEEEDEEEQDLFGEADKGLEAARS